MISKEGREPHRQHIECGSKLYMHRLILDCKPGQMIDHIDGDGLNNLKENLRVVSNRTNQQNQHSPKNNTYVGVYKNRRRFRAQIKINGVIKNLGNFKTELEVSNAYQSAARGFP